MEQHGWLSVQGGGVFSLPQEGFYFISEGGVKWADLKTCYRNLASEGSFSVQSYDQWINENYDIPSLLSVQCRFELFDWISWKCLITCCAIHRLSPCSSFSRSRGINRPFADRMNGRLIEYTLFLYWTDTFKVIIYIIRNLEKDICHTKGRYIIEFQMAWAFLIQLVNATFIF